MAIFAMLVGAVQLSRATKGTKLSEEIVEAALKGATTVMGSPRLATEKLNETGAREADFANEFHEFFATYRTVQKTVRGARKALPRSTGKAVNVENTLYGVLCC